MGTIFGLDFNLFLIIENVAVYVFLAFYIVNNIRKEIKARAYVLREQNNTYYRVFKKYLNNNEESFTFANKTFKVDWKKPAYFINCYWHHVPVFLYHEKYPLPLTVQSETFGLGKDFEKQMRKFYVLVKEKTVEQLVKASRIQILSWSMVLLYIVLTAVACFMVGMFVYPYLNPQQPVVVNATKVG